MTIYNEYEVTYQSPASHGQQTQKVQAIDTQSAETGFSQKFPEAYILKIKQLNADVGLEDDE